MSDKINDREEGSGVPLFGTWRNAYFVIVFIFVCEVVFFYFVSRHFL